ncbi:S-layer homology domain-containing protein [Paenibacillus sp. N3.4]|uniref:S-layer homology domain-containing protein n=1 Tax=Paenibacillus sp. N3.4 TaxID=2603222 RepID=UPI0011C92DCE|nr:S-layer homology domain-containing protein [Paenibacillus sp. N3.4]
MKASASIQFKDKSEIGIWAEKVIELAVEAGLMNGRTDHEFAPKEHANRAESVVVIKRLLAGLSSS